MNYELRGCCCYKNGGWHGSADCLRVGILEMGITGRLGDGKRSDLGLAGISLCRT